MVEAFSLNGKERCALSWQSRGIARSGRGSLPMVVQLTSAGAKMQR